MTAPVKPQDIRDPVSDERNGEPVVSDGIEGRTLVADWLSNFDPPPAITFTQSEFLQQRIAAFAREVAAEAWLEGFGTGMTHPLGNAANPYLAKDSP